jgi:hypothetical protein
VSAGLRPGPPGRLQCRGADVPWGMHRRGRDLATKPAARQRRDDLPGVPRARFQRDELFRLLSQAPADVLPLMAVPAMWLLNLARQGCSAAHCIDGCVTVRCALAEFGIESEIEAVGVSITAGRAAPPRPGCAIGRHPHYNEDGTFNGHTILVIPAAGRLLDPTIQQFPRVPHTALAALPAIGALPVPGGLGTEPVCVDRIDHSVLYVPLAGPDRQAWRSPVIDQRAAEYRAAGANLAAHVFDLMRMPGFRDQTARSPYPRLPRLLSALDGMSGVPDRCGYRFADPASGRELRLADGP